MENYNEETKKEIIRRILEEVEVNGSSRVGYHAEQILVKKPIPYNIKSKLEATIVFSKRYISRLHPNFKNDFEILKNPNFSEEKDNLELQQLRTNNLLLVEQLADFQKIKIQRNVAVIISILSIAATILAALL